MPGTMWIFEKNVMFSLRRGRLYFCFLGTDNYPDFAYGDFCWKAFSDAASGDVAKAIRLLGSGFSRAHIAHERANVERHIIQLLRERAEARNKEKGRAAS